MTGPRPAQPAPPVLDPHKPKAAAAMKRASRACATCHSRKIRCDATLQPPGHPCSYCTSLGAPCEMIPGRRGSTYKKRKRKQALDGNERESRHNSVIRLQHPPSLLVSSPTLNPQINPNLDQHPASASRAFFPLSHHNELTGRVDSFSVTSTATPAAPVLISAATATTAATANNQSADDVWTSPLEHIEEHGESNRSSSRGLLTGASPGTNNSTAPTIEPQTHKRIIYAGETFSHSVLPHLTGHRPFNAGSNPQSEERISHPAVQAISVLAAVAPSPDWLTKQLVVSASNGTPSLFSHLSQEDTVYLCQMKNVLKFPPRTVTDQLMISFIKHFLPAYPVIDRNELQAWYDDFRSGVVKSPLLFHSIFFAASQHVDHSVLNRAGFNTRTEAKNYFHKRAALLYFMDCEKEQLTIIQSLVFICHWWADYSEEKETRYWVSCACNLVHSMGLHKKVPQSLNMSAQEKSLWRRIFWTIFTRDHNVALSFGRPFLIDMADVDVEPLSEEDFYEESREQVANGDFEYDVDCTARPSIHMFFIMELIQLSIILEGIVRTSTAKNGDKYERLALLLSFRDQLYSRLTHPKAETTSHTYSAVGATEKVSDDHMWLAFLQLNRERIVALSHRYLHKVLLEVGSSGQNTPTLTQNREALVRSASRTMLLYDELLSLDLLKHSHSFMNTPIFNALITYVEEIKDSPRDSRRFKVAANKIHLGLLLLDEMRDYWRVASWGHSLFTFLAQQNFAILKKFPRSSQLISPSSPSSGDDGQGNRVQDDGQWAIEDTTFQDLHQWFTDAAFLDPSRNELLDFQPLMFSDENSR